MVSNDQSKKTAKKIITKKQFDMLSEKYSNQHDKAEHHLPTTHHLIQTDCTMVTPSEIT